MRIVILALILATPLLRAQSLGDPRPMKEAEILYYTGAEGMWHAPIAGALRVCGTPLHFDPDGRGWVIRCTGKEVARVEEVPGTVDLKMPKDAAVRTYRLRLQVDDRSELQVASAMAVRCVAGKASAWVVDVDLDGVFLERGEDALLHDDSGTAGPYTGEIWFLRLGLRVVQDRKPSLTRIMDADTEVEAALCLINHYRQVTGFPTVGQDTTLSKGCALHANYVEKNRHLKFNWHTEDPNNPHYTPAGASVARHSLFAFGTYIDGVIGNLDLVYHRRPFLDPDLAAVGLGGLGGSHDVASRRQGGRRKGTRKGGSLGVIALREGRPVTTLALGDGYPWPARGQRGVPTQFTGRELPLPLPKGVSPMGRGFPITFLFHPDGGIGDATLQLYVAHGKRQRKQAVPGFSFGPGHTIVDDGSTYAYAYRNNSGLCHFIAAKPLRPQTRYTARCTYNRGGEKRSVEWSFVTGKGGSQSRY